MPKSKKDMITDIIQTSKAGGCYIDGDLFLALAFRSESELRTICTELHISTTN